MILVASLISMLNKNKCCAERFHSSYDGETTVLPLSCLTKN